MAVQRLHFSTDGLPAASDKARAAAWCESLGGLGYSIDVPEPDGFRGEFDFWASGDTFVAFATASSQVVRRTAPHISADNGDHLYLFVNAGEQPLMAEQRKAQTLLKRHDATLLFNDEPNVMRGLPGGRGIGIRLPRRLEAEFARSGPVIAGAPIAPSHALSLLIGYLRMLSTSRAALPSDTLVAAFAHVADLTLLAIGADTAAVSRERLIRAGELRTAMIGQYIEDQAHHADLTAERVARRFGISPRTLQASFAAQGTSFSDALRGVRLRAARRALEAGDQRSITEVAFDSGFESLSAFYRGWRAVFEDTPGDLIRRRPPR